MDKSYDIYKTVKEIDGRFTCTECGHEWSGMSGDDEIPEVCECQYEDEYISPGDLFYNPMSGVIMPIGDDDDLSFINETCYKIKDKTPFVQLDGFKDGVFTIEGKSREFNFLQMLELADLINGHLKSCGNMIHYLNYYNDFLETLDERLDKEEKDFDEDNTEFRVGENFAMFTGSGTETGMADNGTAGRLIEEAYAKKFPGHTLSFDSESSYCYVYTKDRAEAKRFLEFTYREYIRPVLEPWFLGFKGFAELMKTATPSQKMSVDRLTY